MGNQRIEGWLFDVDELGPEVALWVYTADNSLIRLTHAFQPPVYVQGERGMLKTLAWELERRGIISHVRWAERMEFWSGEVIEVLGLYIADASLLRRLREVAASQDQELIFYNCDIPVAQHYLYTTRLFPLCKLVCEADQAGNVLEIEAASSPWQTDFEMPALRVLRIIGEHMQPRSDKSSIRLECSGEEALLRLREGRQPIEGFNAFIERHDPDIILSEQGDTILMPALLRLARREKMSLMPDRDRVVTTRKIETEGRTYFSYGRIIYKGPSYPLFGRWHIDSRNSFLYGQTRLEGLLEMSRLSKVPVQRMARTSPGTAMTSMQMDVAITEGILVPWRKSRPEDYKTALKLLTVDKGGLSFQPPVGGFEDVAEIDFASMYPAIMVKHNISPETVLCPCCRNQVVPEAEYNICEKRQGLVPRTIAPLIEQRKRYKQMEKESQREDERAKWHSRQIAIKWTLVTGFGYMGYKNARFGRIEAHEAVTAFGREKLLQAKELAEATGFRVLHALTDSLWIKQERATREDLLALCEEITRATEIEMSLEGIYKWIIFLPSKVNATRPVPARYYGVFTDGELKVRGLACRRSDTPEYIREVQMEMLNVVARAATLAEREELLSEVERIAEARILELESGKVDARRLRVRTHLMKEIEDYRVETRTALAARELKRAGVKVHAGERVSYLIADARSKEKASRVKAVEVEAGTGYDKNEYIKLLRATAGEVIQGNNHEGA